MVLFGWGVWTYSAGRVEGVSGMDVDSSVLNFIFCLEDVSQVHVDNPSTSIEDSED